MRIATAVLAIVFASVAAADVSPLWSYYPGYSIPGQNGIVVANIDGDGLSEAVITGSAFGGYSSPNKMHLATLESIGGVFQTTNMTYLASNEYFSGSIRVVRSPVGIPDRIIGITQKNSMVSQLALVTWSGKPLREVSRVNIPSTFKLTQIADVDGDGDSEALGCLCTNNGAGSPMLLDLDTGNPEWTGPQSVIDVGAGQLDADSALEIVVSSANNGPGLILDGATKIQQWSYPDGFRGRLIFGNFRDDSASREFAVVQYWGVTRVFASTPSFSPVLELNTGEAQAVEVSDIDSDGYDDIVIGEGQWGAVRAYSTNAGLVLHTWPHSNDGISAMALGELDAIPGLEIVYGSGLTSSGKDSLHVLDSVSGIERYLRYDEIGPHSSVLLVDTDGDGIEELVFATLASNSGYDGSNLRVLNSANGIELRSRMSVMGQWGSSIGVALKPIDIDGDAAMEIIVALGNLGDGQIAVLDGVTLQDRWRVDIPSLSYIQALELIRFNADAIDDIVAVGGGRVVILDGKNGVELYRSVYFHTTTPMTVAVGQADADAQLEIALSTGTNVYIIDPTLGLFQSFFPNANVLGLSFENTARSCNIVAIHSKNLDRLDCATGAMTSQRDFGLTARWVGIPTNSYGALVLSDGQRLYRAEGQDASARTVELGDDVGARNRGTIKIQGDALDVWVGSVQAVSRVRMPVSGSLFADGFEGF